MGRQRDQGAGYAHNSSHAAAETGGDGGSARGATGGQGGNGARGRGGRPANATRTVFQPTVRAPPLGVQGRTRSGPSRDHAELKAGRSGLALVNRKPAAAPGPGARHTTHDASDDQLAICVAELDSGARAGPANPWVKHAPPQLPTPPAHDMPERTHADEVKAAGATVQLRGGADAGKHPTIRQHSQPLILAQWADRGSRGACSERWDEMLDSGVDHMDGIDDADEGFTSDGGSARGGLRRLEKHQPSAVATPPTPITADSSKPDLPYSPIEAPVTPNTLAAPAAPATPDTLAAVAAAGLAPESVPTKPGSAGLCGAVEPLPNAPRPAEASPVAPPAEPWGSKAKAATGSPAPAAEPSNTRWWKASLSGGSRLAQGPARPAPSKPAAVRAPPRARPAVATASDDGSGRAQNPRNQRGGRHTQTHVPTVLPPVVLARASARTADRKPPTGAGSKSHTTSVQLQESTPATSEPPVSGPGKETAARSVEPASEALATEAESAGVQAADAATPVAGCSRSTGEEPATKPEPLLEDAAPKPAQQVPEAGSGAKAKKRAGAGGQLLAETWRSVSATRPVEPTAEAPTPQAEQGPTERPDIAPNANGRASNVKGTRRPQQQQPQPQPQQPPLPPLPQGEKRERGRASTNSLAAASDNWRSNPNRAEKSHVAAPLLEPIPPSATAAHPARLATEAPGVPASHPWPDTPAELHRHPRAMQYGRGATGRANVLGRTADDRQRSLTQGASVRPRGDGYHGSGTSHHDLMQLSEASSHHGVPASASFGTQLQRPLASTHVGGIHSMSGALPVSHVHGRGVVSPPLLPHAMLADILGDGEPSGRGEGISRSSAQANGVSATPVVLSGPGPGDRAAAVGDANVRNRRISSIVGSGPRDATADSGRRLGYGSRVRSASSLFDVSRSSALAQTPGESPGHDFGGDSGLFMWQHSHKGTGAESAHLPAQPATSLPHARTSKAADSIVTGGQVASEQQPWGYAPAHSAHATLHPLYANGAGGLAVGAAGMVPGFNAFSAGVGMAWPHPGPGAALTQRKSRPPSREDPSSNSSASQSVSLASGKAPRPIGTRGAQRTHGPAYGQPASPQPPPPPHQQFAPPAAHYPWQLHYAVQPPHVYGVPQGAILDNSLSYFSSQMVPAPLAGSPGGAPYMMPVPHMVDMGGTHQPMMVFPQMPMMQPAQPAAPRTAATTAPPSASGGRRDAAAGGNGDAGYHNPVSYGGSNSGPHPPSAAAQHRQPSPLVYSYAYPGTIGYPEQQQQQQHQHQQHYMSYIPPPPPAPLPPHHGGAPQHMSAVPMYMGPVSMPLAVSMAEPSPQLQPLPPPPPPGHMYSSDGYHLHATADSWSGYAPSVPGGAAGAYVQVAGPTEDVMDMRTSKANQQIPSAAVESLRNSKSATPDPRADASARLTRTSSRPGRGGREKTPQETPTGGQATPANPPRRRQPRGQKSQKDAPAAAPKAADNAVAKSAPMSDAKRGPRVDRRRRPGKSDAAASATAVTPAVNGAKQHMSQRGRGVHHKAGERKRAGTLAPADAAT